MDWKSAGEALAKVGLPLLGAALPVPGGAAIGAALASMIGVNPAKPEEVIAAITGNADLMVKARQFELTHEEMLLKIVTDAEIRGIESVNSSIQAEAKSDHWPTYSWRPFIGFSFGIYLNAQWLLPLFALEPPKVDPELMLVIGAILGVASYFRGRMQADPALPRDSRG